MKIEKILNEIKKHTWWIEESPATHQAAEWAWRGFIESSKYFDRRFLSIGIFIYRDDYISEVTPRDEKIKQFHFVLKRYVRNRKYIQKNREKWESIIKTMARDGWKMLKNFEKMNRAELAKEYKLFLDRYLDQARYSAFIECVDPFTEDELPKLLEKELPKASMAERGKIAAIMSAPLALSFMEEERIMFLESCLNAERKIKSASSLAVELEKEYFWIATHYGKAVPKTAQKFKKEIMETLNKKSILEIKNELKSLINKVKKLNREKKKIIKKHKLKKETIAIFSLISEIGSWIDKRKKYAMQGTYLIYHFLDRLEKILKVQKNLLAYATYDEIIKWILSDKDRVDKNILKERRKSSVYLVKLISPGVSKAEFITGKNAKVIYDSIFKVKNLKEFKGTVASSTEKVIEGKVSKVLNTSTDKFKEGDILVTTMTRPDFLPLVRKARAIITDEGGLTCHAAIISRELGIPCIIGAKIATRILKSGNLVRMDMAKGIVKILR